MTSPVVSGPGRYSQRSDQQPIRTPTGLPYGQAQALRQIEQAEPMQATSTPTPQVVPMHAPSQLPGQPVTAGANAGPGPDASVLLQQRAQPVGSPLVQALSNASAGDPSGSLALLLAEAMKRGL